MFNDRKRCRHLAGVLLIATLASGCANPFATMSRRPVLRPMTTQTGSDRLRDHAAQALAPETRPEIRRAPPTTPMPTPARPPAPPQPSSPVDAPPPSPPSGEPDPRAVIDWLLKERR
jgi:hypothetical protein